MSEDDEFPRGSGRMPLRKFFEMNEGLNGVVAFTVIG